MSPIPVESPQSRESFLLADTSTESVPALRVLELPIELSDHAQPFAKLMDCLRTHSSTALPGGQLAWLLPRVEQAGALRAELVRQGICNTAGFSVSPVILTSDRLSDHASTAAWLELRLAAFEALGTVPELTAQARSASQRWALADEYLLLAHACVASQGARSIEALEQANPLAGPEARVVLALANSYHDELQALQAPAPAHPAWGEVIGIVWLDDGDPAASRWLANHAAHRTVYRAPLVHLQQEPVAAVFSAVPDEAGTQGTQTSSLHLLEAHQADEVAHMAAAQVLQWLAQDPQQTIGVAVVDRLMARRLRSLLEAACVQVDDRTGWRLSTTRLAGWLNTLLRGWLTGDWTLWLAALEPQRIGLLQGELAHALRVRWAHGISNKPLNTTWDTLRADAQALAGQSVDEQARQQVHTLLAAFDDFGSAQRPLSRWAADTLQLLDGLQALEALQSDAAGISLLALLRQLARSLQQAECSAALFMLVLSSQMEAARIRPQDVSSPVRFMPLQSFRLQRLSRMLVLGCARRHFVPSPPGLLPPSVAGELGLSDPWLQRSQSLWALAEIVRHTPQCALVHQSQSAGRADPLLGWLRALGLERRSQGQVDWTRQPDFLGRQAQRKPPLPLLAGGLPQPQRLAVKAVADLSVCPLKFVLGHLAGLRDLQPGVQEKREALLRGLWIHDVLERLWRNIGVPADVSDARLWLARLELAATAAWKHLSPPLRSLLYEDRLEFERNLPKLAELMAKRHAQGWVVQQQEAPLSAPLPFHPDCAPVQVHGRMDRLERNGDAIAIVDIKTGSVSGLKARAKNWVEYPQLPLYAWMLGEACDALEYLAVRSDKPAYIALQGPSPSDMVEAVRQQLCESLVQLFVHRQEAAPKPGDECRYCDHAGTCRSQWLQEGAQ